MKKMENEELVSVVMSVYNAELNGLKRAVDSILKQTYSNLEFIIVLDGADKDCETYLLSIDDDRVNVIDNGHNIGLAASLNRGIDIAKGKYIARMDADDYSYPNRLQEQIGYMEAHPEIDVLACIVAVSRHNRIVGTGGAYRRFDNEDIRIKLSMGPMTFPHPSVVFRTDFLRENNLQYNEAYKRAQDYDMWVRCIKVGRLYSLQKVLLEYNDDSGCGTVPSPAQRFFSDLTKAEELKVLIPDASAREQELYINLRDTCLTGSPEENTLLVEKLVSANRMLRIYDPKKYERFMYSWWGRKILYSQNREFLFDFLKKPRLIYLFILNAVIDLPEHLMQKQYENNTFKVLKKNSDL